ncbi:MAG: DNA repair protein RadA, partial [Chlorobiales bacterium]|nr:DNA repair protein RadA [Chlorobiales bacterium]
GLRDIPADSSTVAIGEIGLAGELRAVSHVDRRIIEAQKLGFARAVVPKSNRDSLKNPGAFKGIEVIFCPTLSKALDAFLS